MEEPRFLERPITKLVVLLKSNQEVSEHTEEDIDPVIANVYRDVRGQEVF